MQRLSVFMYTSLFHKLLIMTEKTTTTKPTVNVESVVSLMFVNLTLNRHYSVIFGRARVLICRKWVRRTPIV